MARVTQLQGSLFCKAAFTIRLIDDPLGAADTSDFVVAAGTQYRSINAFLRAWEAEILADISITYTMQVVRTGASKGKLEVTSAGDNMSIDWAHAGDSTEATRWFQHLGATVAASSDVTSPFTLPNAHKAGLYPALGARILQRSSTGARRGHGVRLGNPVAARDLGSWTQHDTTAGDQGQLAVDVELALDARTDWSELYDLRTFVDEVFAEMGEPFSVIHLDTGDTSADAYTGFFAASPVELMAKRLADGWNDYLAVSFTMDGTEVVSS